MRMQHLHAAPTVPAVTVSLILGMAISLAADLAIANAQGVPPPAINTNPSSSLTIPQQSELPVSPTNPGTLPGTTAPDTAIERNPVTGAPCAGGGASAIDGGIPGAPTAADQPAEAGQQVTGLPSNNSVFGLSSEVPNGSNPGSC